MPLATLLLFTALAQTQDKAEYQDKKLGLQFNYPKNWKLRRDRFSAVFEIPLADGKTASVQLFNANYKGTAEDWQLIQQEINRSMKRPIERQWTEEFLGVPMLLTKTAYTELDKNLVGIVGLLYTAYVDKMHFRLTSPADVAEQAEAAWRDSMLTLRTVSGELPTTEDPNSPSLTPKVPVPTSVWAPVNKPKKPVRGPELAELTVGETKFKLSLPKGWSVSGNKLVDNSVAGQIEVTAVIGLPEEAGQNLLTSAKEALDQFKTVTLREDPKPDAVPSGAVVGRVFRVGTGADGTLIMGCAVGYCEGIYWSIKYRTNDPKTYERDKPALTQLFRLMYAERA